jgi:hypothetical protein
MHDSRQIQTSQLPFLGSGIEGPYAAHDLSRTEKSRDALHTAIAKDGSTTSRIVEREAQGERHIRLLTASQEDGVFGTDNQKLSWIWPNTPRATFPVPPLLRG